jgi:hypothetical protein
MWFGILHFIFQGVWNFEFLSLAKGTSPLLGGTLMTFKTSPLKRDWILEMSNQ